MPLNWRVWPLLLIAMMLIVSGIVPQTVAAQLSSPAFHEDLGFDPVSQGFPDSHWEFCRSRIKSERTMDVSDARSALRKF